MADKEPHEGENNRETSKRMRQFVKTVHYVSTKKGNKLSEQMKTMKDLAKSNRYKK